MSRTSSIATIAGPGTGNAQPFGASEMAGRTQNLTTGTCTIEPAGGRRQVRRHLARLAGAMAITAAALPLAVAAPSPAYAGTEVSVGIIGACGSTEIKTTLWGQWQQHTACSSVKDVELSPNGQYTAVINADGSLAIKQGLWGAWATHLGANDTRDVAFGPNGMVGVVNGCGSAYIKTSIGGAWQQHTPCNSVTNIEISPDGQYFAVINANGSLAIKQGLWGGWATHIGAGDARDVAFGPSGMVGLVNGCGSAYIKTSIGGAWQQHSPCNSVSKIEISPDGQTVAVLNSDGSVASKPGLWAAWQNHLGAGTARDVALAPGMDVPPLGVRIAQFAQQQAFTELNGNDCNPYTHLVGAGGTGTSCPAGQRSQAWCADFAKYVWTNNGANVGGLSSAASSFASGPGYRAGATNNPQVGDAIVWGGGGHVGIVVEVYSSTDLLVTNGNWSNKVSTVRIDPRSAKANGGGVLGYKTPQPA